jgi:hypothetical protein
MHLPWYRGMTALSDFKTKPKMAHAQFHKRQMCSQLNWFVGLFVRLEQSLRLNSSPESLPHWLNLFRLPSNLAEYFYYSQAYKHQLSKLHLISFTIYFPSLVANGLKDMIRIQQENKKQQKRTQFQKNRCLNKSNNTQN